MSSTNKTQGLKLNSWIGSDKPERIDFNTDNEIIDKAVTDHTSNTTVHISESEREKWNNYMFTGMYYGDGSVSRTVTTNCPFKARAGFIYANARPMDITRFSDSKKNNYFGAFSYLASSLGVKFGSDGKSFTVSQTANALTANEYFNLNEVGVAYNYILFR